jgi:hypothetical protein
MKAYVYFDSDLLHALPMSIEQIERARVKLPSTFEAVDDPRQADIFWLPVDLGHVEAYHGGARAVAQYLPRLPYWKGNERRHVAYFCSDGAEPTGLPCIMFRQSFHKDRADENVIAWPYAVDDFGYLATDDFSTLPYDVSFVGSRVSHKCRIESYDSVSKTPDLISFLDDSKMHWGSIEHTEVGKKRKQLFIESMRVSALVLAARGGGLSCYRFFEAMSAGRVPVLLADDWQLPHADMIDWGKCIIQIPECRAKDTGRILLEYLRRISDEELAEMGRECRLAWTQYLAPAAWPKMMERCVKEKLGL